MRWKLGYHSASNGTTLNKSTQLNKRMPSPNKLTMVAKLSKIVSAASLLTKNMIAS